MFKSLVTLAAAVAALLSAGPVVAQNYGLEPTYGSATVQAPTAHVVDVQAGGWKDPTYWAGRGCDGWVAEAPDFRFRYAPGDAPLTVSVRSEGETTLLINDPGGRWHCADTGETPSLTFEAPQAGLYDVWVGYRRREGERAPHAVFPATLSIVTAAAD